MNRRLVLALVLALGCAAIGPDLPHEGEQRGPYTIVRRPDGKPDVETFIYEPDWQCPFPRFWIVQCFPLEVRECLRSCVDKAEFDWKVRSDER